MRSNLAFLNSSLYLHGWSHFIENIYYLCPVLNVATCIGDLYYRSSNTTTIKKDGGSTKYEIRKGLDSSIIYVLFEFNRIDITR